MAYLILSALLIIGLLFIKKYRVLSWHSVLSIVFISLIVTDILDIVLCYVLRLYSLHLGLFENPAVDIRNAILVSDLIILPLITVIFCYYFARYRRWWVAIIYPISLSLLEFVFVRLGYIEYHHFHHIFTFILYSLGAALLYYIAGRMIDYSPPIPDTIMIMPAAYVIMAFPGTILGTVLNFFLWRPGVFPDFIADNWVVAVSMGSVSGILGGLGFWIFESKLARNLVIILIGLIDLIISFILLAKGILVYYKWNSVYHTLMIVSSTILLVVYNWWESKYRESLKRQY